MTLRRSSLHGLDTLVLTDGEAVAEVCPSRGALVTRFAVGNDELLFLDEATFKDPSKNVRGGVPVLFPVAGPPPAGSPLKQHGFARTTPWQQVGASDHQLTLALQSTEATRALFPFEFELTYVIGLKGSALTLEWTVHNTSGLPMPLHFGLHPYFRAPLEGKPKARIDTDATRAWNNRSKVLGPMPAQDFGGEEVDLHLLNHSRPQTVFHRGDGSSVRLSWSPSFRTVVLWTLPGQPFVCIEPWSEPGEAAMEGRPRATLAPDASAQFMFRISR